MGYVGSPEKIFGETDVGFLLLCRLIPPEEPFAPRKVQRQHRHRFEDTSSKASRLRATEGELLCGSSNQEPAVDR